MTRPHPAIAPVYVEPFAGAAAVWLRLLDPSLVPPVSWMGGKRRLADRILGLLGLTPGRPVPAILGDASWWGWVWPAVLDPITGPRVSEVLRSWRGEDPRALWFRLRDAGPAEDLAERAAGLLWLQARAASGVPVWWEGGDVVSMNGDGNGPYRAWQKQGGETLVQWASTRIDDAGQTRTATRPNAGKGFNAAGAGGIVNPGTVADRLDAVRLVCDHRVPGPAAEGGIARPEGVAARLDRVRSRRPPVEVHHADALDLVRGLAYALGGCGRYFLDPPYLGCTGYPAECPRERVLQVADECARHGGRVVLSEAVDLSTDLGPGWTAVQLKRGKRPEWVTTYRCDAWAVHGPLFVEARP